jgi:hypothetical protein
LFVALKNGFGIDYDEEVRDLLEPIKIIHVHGHLGHFSWQNVSGQVAYPYSPQMPEGRLRQTAESIIVINEANPDTPEFTAAKKAIRQAKFLFFLGFGYLRENLDHLGIDKLEIHKNPVCHGGSCYGMTIEEVMQLKSQYPRLDFYEPHNHIHYDCLQHIRHSDLFLTASSKR